MASRIEDYAIIGDMRTAALVSRNGSIDWLCLPRFDSSSCFAALLGTPEHGRWLIGPVEKARVTRRYRQGTLILESRFKTTKSEIMLIDFMPTGTEHSCIVRLAVGLSGTTRIRSDLVIRFDYGVTVPWVSRTDERTLTAVAGPNLLTLRTTSLLLPCMSSGCGERSKMIRLSPACYAPCAALATGWQCQPTEMNSGRYDRP